MKSTTVAIVAVLLLFVFRLDTQVFISAGKMTARDETRAVCPPFAINATNTCDEETINLYCDRCRWLAAQKVCLRKIFNACNEVNEDMRMDVEALLLITCSAYTDEC